MRWSQDEVNELKKLLNNKTYKEISQRLGRSIKSIEHQAAKQKQTIQHDKQKTETLQKKISILEHQVDTFKHNQTQQYNVDEYSGEAIRFGVIADTHLGSLYDNIEYLTHIYNVFQNDGLNVVYHAGDLADGERMYRGHEYEIRHHGFENQKQNIVDNYPCVDGMVTKFITGNHDLSFWKTTQVDIGKYIAAERPDMIYLGQEQADITLRNSCGQTVLRLYHPGGGTAYAISYRSQKYIEALTGGEKPGIAISGHFHKAEFLPNYRNVQVFQAGCIQKQTPFMARKPTAAMVGAWIIELVLNECGVIRCKGEFLPWYA